MSSTRRGHPILAIVALAALLATAVPADAARKPRPRATPEPASLIPAGSPIRMRCIMCHRVDAEGRIPKIESIRTTPEEWGHIVERMVRVNMKMRQLPPPEGAERKLIVQQLADKLALSPEETERMAYMFDGPVLTSNEHQPEDPVFRQTCLGCHSYGKILAHRRTPEAWARLKDFHVAMWPTILLIFGEYDWPSTASAFLQQLAKQQPRDSDSWKSWRALPKKPLLPGTWYVRGSQPGRGDYDGHITFTGHGGGSVSVTRTIRFEDGPAETWTGKAQLYAGHLAEGDVERQGAHARLTVQLGRDLGAATGRWYVRSDRHVYGREHYYRNTSKEGRILSVSPRALYRLAPAESLTIKLVGGPANPGPRDISLGDKNLQVRAVKRIDANTLQVSIRLGDRAAVGAKQVQIGKARASGLLVVADKVDYIQVSPNKALARLGGIRFPKGSVQFMAQAYANGPDRRGQTNDDLYLGPVKANWTLEPYFVTNFDATKPELSGQLDQSGLFTPADEGINLATATHNNNGRVWVVARYRPSAASRELTARAYMMIGFPDFNRAIN